MKFNDIVMDYLKTIHPYDKHHLQNLNTKDLISLHHSMGRGIRNNYNLWYIKLEDEPYNNMHPDDLSMEIIKAVHKQL